MKNVQAAIVVLLIGLGARIGLGQTQPIHDAEVAWLITRLPPVDAPRIPSPADPLALTLANLERFASQGNPTVARAAAAVGAARGNWLQVGLPPNPRLGAGQQQIGSHGRAEQDNVTFSQEFVGFVKLRLSRELAAKEIARAEQELAVQRTRVMTDVRVAFYSAIIAQRQRAVADELVRIARDGLQAAEKADRESPIFQNDFIEARIELRTAEIEARKSLNRHLSSWRSLAAVIGNPELPLTELVGDVETVATERDWENSLQRLRSQSPEFAVAITQIDRARAAWRRAAIEPMPNIMVDALYNWRDNGIDGQPDGGIQVSLPLPVWNRNQGAVAQAAAELGMAERDFERLELDLQNRLAPVYERYTTAHFQLRQYRDTILPDAREALRLTQENYRAGKVDYDDLLTSQRTNAQANLDYLNALRELRIAEAEMDGFLLTDSLAVP